MSSFYSVCIPFFETRSTFRQMTVLFPPEQAGPVLGWTSAVAAYGAAVPESGQLRLSDVGS